MIINKKGITLIEIIIAIAILGVVLAMSSRLLNFGLTIFDSGGERFDVQFEVRMASDFISDEMRYAKNIVLQSSQFSSFDSDKEYLFIDGNGVLVHVTEGNPKEMSAPILDVGTGFTLTYQEGRSTLIFELKGIFGEESFSTATSVYLNNISSEEGDAVTGQYYIEYEDPTS